MTTSKLRHRQPSRRREPPRHGDERQGFRSLSRAMFRGFVRDRAALFFTILFPVLFLVLFGSIYKSSSHTAGQRGRGRPGQRARPGAAGQRASCDKVLTVTHTANLAHALDEVRQGDVDAAVQQQGGRLIVHYSIAEPHHGRGGQQRVLRDRAGGEPGRVA